VRPCADYDLSFLALVSGSSSVLQRRRERLDRLKLLCPAL
jgi:hypothetical protein